MEDNDLRNRIGIEKLVPNLKAKHLEHVL